ncbi:MAG: hypothetical protein AAGB24_09520 [Bacteroidota bacterium]
MNKSRIIRFSVFLLAFFALTWSNAQTKTKTFKETFNVGDDAVLNIDTSHTDIEFETWDKNQVEITAVVTLEGATDKEAEAYFKNDPIEMMGNSKEIEIRTSAQNSWLFAPEIENLQHFNVEIPAIDLEPLFLDLEIPELPELAVIPELPPMPPIPFKQFDYSAYQKDGDVYLKKWTKEFREGFDEEYEARFREWGKRIEERAKQREEQTERRNEEREQLLEEREREREERLKLAQERREAAIERLQAEKERILKERSLIISNESDDAPNVFYFSSDGEDKRYKVQKTIKVKMPKATRIKMDVRHGEVKLAATVKNINASLSYASLLASTIDGGSTDIKAAYSPVSVQKWNYGQLKTNYSERVNLKEVGELKLNSVSSNVIIDRLIKKAHVTNNLGALQINSIADDFSDMDISIQNGELNCTLPTTPFVIYINETSTNFKYPNALAIGSSRNYETTIHKGYHINNNTKKSININSRYSEVVLKE